MDESINETILSINSMSISDKIKDRIKSLGFRPQKENVYNKCLPYRDQLDEECIEYLSQIKANISKAIVLNDRHGFQWIPELCKYIELFGRMFSKSDHIYFIDTIYEVMIIPGLELRSVQICADVLSTLLHKQKLLTPNDLTIRWRPLYELFERTVYSKFLGLGMLFLPNGFQSSLSSLVYHSRSYFSIDSTQEMLVEWRPLLCPFDSVIEKAVFYLTLFLPTALPAEHHDKGFKLWFNELIELWRTSQNTPSWEPELISLFARLADESIGYIDWNQYIPEIFTRLMRSFELMKSSTSDINDFSTCSAVTWFVAMLGPNSDCQKHITKLFKAIQSYYHPSNIGRWSLKLQKMLSHLTGTFIDRLRRERYEKHSWRTPVPETHKLKEEDINEFVKSLEKVVMISMFSQFGSGDAAIALRNLALLRPEIIVPPVLHNMYSSLDALTEPHRLLASMQCVISIARTLVKSSETYKEGPTHVLPLLFHLLKGLDINDIQKCILSFRFISTFITLIPVIDCSSAVAVRTDLTPIEIKLCLATAQFKDFVLQFMDQCFGLIENSSLDLDFLDSDDITIGREEDSIEIDLLITFSAVLIQCSPPILETAIDKLFSFVSTHIFETKLTGKLAAILVRCSSMANTELTLQKFLPHYCQSVLTLTKSDDILSEEFLSNEILFDLQVLSQLVRCDGKYLPKYKDLIVKVLDRTLHLKCKKGYFFSTDILKYVLKSLTLFYALDFRSIPHSWHSYSQFDKHMPVRDWGCAGDINNLNAKWHEPNDEELAFAQQILDHFLRTELNNLKNWINGQKKFTREELNRNLIIIMDCLNGSASALPFWSGDDIVFYESLVSTDKSFLKSFYSKSINFSNNENIRETVLLTMRSTLAHLMKTCEDDTKSLCTLIVICDRIMFFFGEMFMTAVLDYQLNRQCLENRLIKKEKYIRALIINRVMARHELRAENKCSKFTELHKLLVKDLMQLSVSHYSNVRMTAQSSLFNSWTTFPYSYRLILPDLIRNLSKEEKASHQRLKGSLYIILGRSTMSLLRSHEWSTHNVLWPALADSQHSEKPSIINLLDEEIQGSVRENFETLASSVDIPNSCVQLAKKVWTEKESLPKPKFDCPTEEEIKNAMKIAEKRKKTNIELYLDLIEKLVNLLNRPQPNCLPWRYYVLTYGLLRLYIRHDISLPTSAVNLFTKNLINETLMIRKISIDAFCGVLRQMKRKHNKTELKPLPEDNQWLQIDTSLVINTEEEYNSTNFIDKPHIGFYCYPKPTLVYEKSDSYKTVSLSENERIIYKSFSAEVFIKKLFTYLSMEENKGEDSFSEARFLLWKGLFRNVGSIDLQLFVPIITEFVNSSEESCNRCAAELISGLVRGSKHWNFKDLMKLRSNLEPIFKQIMNCITIETLDDWVICSSKIFGNRDARRLLWILNIYLDDPLRGKTRRQTSFLQLSRLSVLRRAVNESEWRSQKILRQLLTYLMDNHLSHPYKNVRECIGSLLSDIFTYDMSLPALPRTYEFSPKRSEFVNKIIARLDILYIQGSDNANNTQNRRPESQSPERKEALNLLKTMCRMIVDNVCCCANSAPPELFRFLSLLCLMQNQTNDEELIRETLLAINMLSQSLLTTESIESVIEISKQVTRVANWRARKAIVFFLRRTITSNLFILMNNELWIKEITKMVLQLLTDKRTEVRESTAETLSGLMHCEFIRIDDKLINYFKSKSGHKLNKMRQTNGMTIIDPKDLTVRHSGILGICSAINAFPYDVPDFMPDLLVFLTSHLNDPQPILQTIKKTLSNFRRTHNDNWVEHKSKFTEEQLSYITDLLVSPTYYA